jgi:hypothetical protein
MAFSTSPGSSVPARLKIVVGVSIALYAASLTQTAISFRDYDEPGSYHAMQMLLIGAIGYLGGALPEWLIWMANPLYFTSILLLFRKNERGLKTSLAALVLAATFATWKEILVSESGRNARITALEAGYWLWLAAVMTLAAGLVTYECGERKVKQNHAI